MKSISNILRKSNITPFERVKILIQNNIQKEKTGKDKLSESDLYALTKGWSPSVSEAKEYNRYLDIIRLEDTMKMDTQMFLYRSEVAILRNQRIIDNFLSNTRRLNNIYDQTFTKHIPIKESVEFLTQHTYLEYEKVLHIFTFQNLPEEIQSDLLLLDEEVSINEEYLRDHVFLYERFENGNTLNKQDKDLIINRIYSRMYYEGVKKIKNSTAEKDGFLFTSFFAELPTKDLFQKIADDAHITYSNEDSLLSTVEEYAKSRNMSIEQLVKDTLSLWLDDGLFTKDYSPLFMSERLDTWNGNTKKNHRELFMAWYVELQKSKKYFQKLFDADKLKKQIIERDFLGMPRTIEIITGKSLYACKEDIIFVREYKQQIKILTPVSSMFLFAKKHATPTKSYQTLYEFKNLAEKVSSVFDIDMTEKYTECVDMYQEEIMLLNYSLSRLLDTVTTKAVLQYTLDITDNCFVFDLNTDNEVACITKRYKEEFKF